MVSEPTGSPVQLSRAKRGSLLGYSETTSLDHHILNDTYAPISPYTYNLNFEALLSPNFQQKWNSVILGLPAFDFPSPEAQVLPDSKEDENTKERNLDKLERDMQDNSLNESKTPLETFVEREICNEEVGRHPSENLYQNYLKDYLYSSFEKVKSFCEDNGKADGSCIEETVMESSFQMPQTSLNQNEPVLPIQEPIQASFEQEQIQASFEQEPIQASFEQEPIQASFEQEPIQAGFEQEPIQAGFEQDPIQAGFEQEPIQSSFEQEPIQDGFEQEPIQASFEQEPIHGSFEQEPIQASFEQEPIQASFEQEPIQAGFEQEPIQASFEQEPIQASFEQEPIQAGFEQEPIQASFEQEPIQDSFEQEPIQAGFEQEPIQASLEQEPIQGSFEQEPIQASFEQEPEDSVSNNTESKIGPCFIQ
eukprot:XP_011680752.1 PREDICTED: paternally-expressed gene 3 protein-like [Strongylocentrotus purpuratus]